MSGKLSQLKRYLHETLGAEVSPTPWHKAKRLPFFLRDIYTFFEIQLLEASCLLMVDRLSLYLSLKENKDERVEAVLEEMMKGLQW